MNKSKAAPSGDITAPQDERRLKRVLHRLVEDGPERRAIDAGEIDALIDYKGRHIILFPLAESALRAAHRPTAAPDPLSNAILAALPHQEYQRLDNKLEAVMLKADELLQEAGSPIRYVYFPIDCVIGLLATVESRKGLEIALVGSEGMVGFSMEIGPGVSPVRALVAIAGSAVRLPEECFREVYGRNPALREDMNRFTCTELAVARQTAACSAFHNIEQRFARRLLMIADRLHSDRFFCTHESAARALGVRRESVSQAAGTLQKRGLISYRRGHIQVLKRGGLESAACNCYREFEIRSVRTALPASVQD